MKKLNPVERSNYINKRYKEYLSSTFTYYNEYVQFCITAIKTSQNWEQFKSKYGISDLRLAFIKNKVRNSN